MEEMLQNQIQPITFSKAADVPKGWGKEVWIANLFEVSTNFPPGYSGKLLCFNRIGAMSSMHFHTVKHETFYVLDGTFTLCHYNPETAQLLRTVLHKGNIVTIPPHNPHQLLCETTSGTIAEFASADYSWDSYRTVAGDSQRGHATQQTTAT